MEITQEMNRKIFRGDDANGDQSRDVWRAEAVSGNRRRKKKKEKEAKFIQMAKNKLTETVRGD